MKIHVWKVLLVLFSLMISLPGNANSTDGMQLTLEDEQQEMPRALPDKLYGVTIDSISSLPATLDALSSLSKKPMTRIVFDEWQPATLYTSAVSQIYSKSYVLGEILDSSAMKQYSLAQYKARTSEYLKAMYSTVDLWEVGNEINGEWLGGTSAVVAKMSAAFDLVKAKNAKTALTLYYNPDCWAKPSHEMFRWATQNIPDRMKTGLDYVLVSYYEEDCNNYQPDWQNVMSRVAQLFPNSKVGIGECGTRDPAKKAALSKQYYSLKLNIPSFIGGYFWWYFKQDMVPKTQPLWTVLNDMISQN
ncbi:MAG: hypothetical protein ACKOA8_06110 [Deltaproteobacteria bacterium]